MAKQDGRALTKEELDALPVGSKVITEEGFQHRKILTGDAHWFSDLDDHTSSKYLADYKPTLSS